MTLLQIDGVTVRYGTTVALTDVSLAAEAGELVAITGPSGAGKTTLLRAASRIVEPVTGEVRVVGRVPRTHAEGLEAGVVLIPQGSALALSLTALENVLVPLAARGVRGEEAVTRAREALEAVGLGESTSHRAEELSGGQQQRVAVARGLAQRGRVLLADEPTSELDHATREVVLDLLRDAVAGGALVVMATHDPEVAESADRVVHLDEGRVVAPYGALAETGAGPIRPRPTSDGG